MNKKCKIDSHELFEAPAAATSPEARAKLEEIKAYMEHVNIVILPILKECNFHVSTPQLVQMVADPRLLPMGKGNDLAPVPSPGIEFIRFCGRKMILNQCRFREKYG